MAVAPEIDDKRELMDLISVLRNMRVKDSQVWSVVAKNLVVHMNRRGLNQTDVSEVAFKLSSMTLRSAQIYDFLLQYFVLMEMKFEEQPFANNFRFIKAIAVNHGQT